MPKTVIKIELIYPLPTEQELLCIEVPLGSSIQQAIELAGILQRYPEIDLASNKVGIFSQVKSLATELREGDRIEIYRGLIADPKEARKKKASLQKKNIQART